MKIYLHVLKSIVNEMFKQLEGKNVESFEVTEDYYWFIPHDSAYNMDVKPDELTVGQLSEDLKELNKLLTTKEYEPVLYNFVWLSEIFKVIGKKTFIPGKRNI